MARIPKIDFEPCAARLLAQAEAHPFTDRTHATLVCWMVDGDEEPVAEPRRQSLTDGLRLARPDLVSAAALRERVLSLVGWMVRGTLQVATPQVSGHAVVRTVGYDLEIWDE